MEEAQQRAQKKDKRKTVALPADHARPSAQTSAPVPLVSHRGPQLSLSDRQWQRGIKIFRRIDRNGTGLVTVSELQILFRDMAFASALIEESTRVSEQGALDQVSWYDLLTTTLSILGKSSRLDSFLLELGHAVQGMEVRALRGIPSNDPRVLSPHWRPISPPRSPTTASRRASPSIHRDRTPTRGARRPPRRCSPTATAKRGPGLRTEASLAAQHSSRPRSPRQVSPQDSRHHHAPSEERGSLPESSVGSGTSSGRIVEILRGPSPSPDPSGRSRGGTVASQGQCEEKTGCLRCRSQPHPRPSSPSPLVS